MNSKLLMIIGGTIVGVVVSLGIAKVFWDRKNSSFEVNTKSDSPYAGIIQETLKTHQGEDNPFVQAFEAALAEEEGFERDLSRQAGLRQPA